MPWAWELSQYGYGVCQQKGVSGSLYRKGKRVPVMVRGGTGRGKATSCAPVHADHLQGKAARFQDSSETWKDSREPGWEDTAFSWRPFPTTTPFLHEQVFPQHKLIFKITFD